MIKMIMIIITLMILGIGIMIMSNDENNKKINKIMIVMITKIIHCQRQDREERGWPCYQRQ